MMNRRFFVGSGSAALSSLVLGVPGARAQSLNRAAIVIGVSKTSDLPVLHSTVPGAKQVAAFLEGEGYDVRLHTDENAPVKIDPIFDDVAAFVGQSNLDQFLVFFSGHGFWQPYSGEMWLLSKALDNQNQAINLVESAEVCGYCGIPNVIFVSDACRSQPESLGARHVTGSNIFPNCDGQHSADIDKFFAAKPGNPSFEVPVGVSTGNYQSIFTEAFLNAFRTPRDNMILHLNSGIDVVPNRKLEPFLIDETQRLALEAGLLQNVQPDADVPSADTVYIGRAQASGTDPGTSFRAATLEDVFAQDFERFGVQIARPKGDVSAAALLTRKRNLTERQLPAMLAPVQEFDLRGAPSGIAVYGEHVAEVAMAPGVRFQRLDGGFEAPARALIGTDLAGGPAQSALVVFQDGTSAVVAVLADYVTHIFVGPLGVEGMSFEPVPGGPRDFGGEDVQHRLAELRFLVTQASTEGVFRIGGAKEERNQQAARLADQIRVLKGLDPTLGILAAYAYSYARLPDKVDSVRWIMSGDLNVRLFDTELLSRRSRAQADLEPLDQVTPFCPMARAGWELLRVKGVAIPPPAMAARRHLRNSLWTTFNPPGTEALFDAISRGEIR